MNADVRRRIMENRRKGKAVASRVNENRTARLRRAILENRRKGLTPSVRVNENRTARLRRAILENRSRYGRMSTVRGRALNRVNENFKSKRFKRIPLFENFLDEKYGIELVDGCRYTVTADLFDSTGKSLLIPAGTVVTYRDCTGTCTNNEEVFSTDCGCFIARDGQEFAPENLLSNGILKPVAQPIVEDGDDTEDITEEETQAIVEDPVIEPKDVEKILDKVDLPEETEEKIKAELPKGDVSIADIVDAVTIEDVTTEQSAEVIKAAVAEVVDAQEINESFKPRLRSKLYVASRLTYHRGIYEKFNSKKGQRRNRQVLERRNAIKAKMASRVR